MFDACGECIVAEEKIYKKRLDDICMELAPDVWINPHRSIWGTGNYDANILNVALDRLGIDVEWYDKEGAR